MSLLGKYFRGWSFRSTTPSLVPGSEVNIFVSEYDGDGVGIANVGDTRLYVEGVDPDDVGRRVRVAVTSFDETDATGRGEFREVVGESSYAG
ncbi:DUF7513 family protein [Halosolutus halophilus]|uniref:DUF7513 family protein n=1 Tax=Halosolutus halophilus TaxID=1552990 RepID=UPI0022352C89|nr:TRAM domain-containing protein [Halosolutus halophilus]